jgi:hypothetical protein
MSNLVDFLLSSSGDASLLWSLRTSTLQSFTAGMLKKSPTYKYEQSKDKVGVQVGVQKFFES